MYKKYESFSITGLYFETIIKLGDFFFFRRNGRAAIAYVLERAWPYAIDAVPLQFGTAQITKVTAQFYYTRHHVIHANAPETTQKAKLKKNSLNLELK